MQSLPKPMFIVFLLSHLRVVDKFFSSITGSDGNLKGGLAFDDIASRESHPHRFCLILAPADPGIASDTPYRSVSSSAEADSTSLPPFLQTARLLCRMQYGISIWDVFHDDLVVLLRFRIVSSSFRNYRHCWGSLIQSRGSPSSLASSERHQF